MIGTFYHMCVYRNIAIIMMIIQTRDVFVSIMMPFLSRDRGQWPRHVEAVGRFLVVHTSIGHSLGEATVDHTPCVALFLFVPTRFPSIFNLPWPATHPQVVYMIIIMITTAPGEGGGLDRSEHV